MFRQYALCYIFVLSSFSFLLSSCSLNSNWITKQTGSQVSTLEVTPQAPISISLSQAYVLQKKLILKVELFVKDEVSTADTVIGLLGLSEGAINEEQYIKLSNIIDEKVLQKGSRIVLPFELELTKLTELQLIASWGEEGKQLIADKLADDIFNIEQGDLFALKDSLDSTKIGHVDKVSFDSIEDSESSLGDNISGVKNPIDLMPPEPVKPLLPDQPSKFAVEFIKKKELQDTLVLEDIQIFEDIIPCEVNRCAKKIRMKASLKNYTNKPLHLMKLAFGLFWVSDGKVPILPEDDTERRPGEEELDFGSKVLTPNESLEFQVNIGRPVFDLPGGKFIPHVRILHYEDRILN